MLLNGTEGEVYANPLRCPAISLIDGAGAEPQELLARQPEQSCDLPQSKEAAVTAARIQQVLDKARPVPQSLRLQIACCYVASGRSPSLEAGWRSWRPPVIRHPEHQPARVDACVNVNIGARR